MLLPGHMSLVEFGRCAPRLTAPLKFAQQTSFRMSRRLDTGPPPCGISFAPQRRLHVPPISASLGNYRPQTQRHLGYFYSGLNFLQ
jgi:hypothetical protein